MKTICTKCNIEISAKTCNTCIKLLADQGQVWINHNSFLSGYAAKAYSGPLFDVEEYKCKQQEPQSDSWRYAKSLIQVYNLESSELVASSVTHLITNYNEGSITEDQAGDTLTNAVTACFHKQVIKNKVGKPIHTCGCMNDPSCKACYPNNKQVYLINGFKRSGKDYTAEALANAYRSAGKTVDVVAFADPMKQIVSTMFGITLEQLNTYKNNPDKYEVATWDNKYDAGDGNTGEVELSTTNFRSMLQRFGNEAMKPIFGDSVWADRTYDIVDKSTADIVIVSDYRFPIEYDTLIELPCKVTTVNIIGSDTNTDSHASEQKPNRPFNHTIDNSSRDTTVIDWVNNQVGVQ